MTPMVPMTVTSGARADGRFDKRDFLYNKKRDEYRCPAGKRAIHRFSTVEKGLTIHVYWSSACPKCPLKNRCTPSDYRRIRRWEHEEVLEAMQRRLERMPEALRVRRSTVEHPFGTIKAWMGATHFLTKTLPKVRTEMSLHVLAYNMKRAIKILGTRDSRPRDQDLARSLYVSKPFAFSWHNIAQKPAFSHGLGQERPLNFRNRSPQNGPS